MDPFCDSTQEVALFSQPRRSPAKLSRAVTFALHGRWNSYSCFAYFLLHEFDRSSLGNFQYTGESMMAFFLALVFAFCSPPDELSEEQKGFLSSLNSPYQIWWYCERAASGLFDLSLTEETRIHLREIDHEVDREAESTRKWLLPLVPRSLRTQTENRITRAAAEIFVDRASEYISDDLPIAISQLNFQHLFLFFIGKDTELSELLDLSDKQLEEIESLAWPRQENQTSGSPSRVQHRPREYVSEDGKDTQSRQLRNRTEVRIWVLLNDEQKQAVVSLCGPPMRGSWLEFALALDEQAEIDKP